MTSALHGLGAYGVCRLSLLVGRSPLSFASRLLFRSSVFHNPVVSGEQGHVLLWVGGEVDHLRLLEVFPPRPRSLVTVLHSAARCSFRTEIRCCHLLCLKPLVRTCAPRKEFQLLAQGSPSRHLRRMQSFPPSQPAPAHSTSGTAAHTALHLPCVALPLILPWRLLLSLQARHDASFPQCLP